MLAAGTILIYYLSPSRYMPLQIIQLHLSFIIRLLS